MTCTRWSCEACDNQANEATRKDPPTTSAEDPDGQMPTGLLVGVLLLLLLLLVGVLLLLLGGICWLACCLWAVCRKLKTASPAHVSTGGENRAGSNLESRQTGSNNLVPVSSKQSQERNKQAQPGAISEEGPDYENTRGQKSVYDAMYEN